MPRLAKPVILPAADASKLWAIVKKGTHKSRKIARARALLAMGSGKSAGAVQAQMGICTTQYYRLKGVSDNVTVLIDNISTTQYYRPKGRHLTGGLTEALEERPRSGQPPKVTAALEARITSLACSELPVGAARWTLSLLNETLVSLHYGPAISKEKVRQVLKKVNSSPD